MSAIFLILAFALGQVAVLLIGYGLVTLYHRTRRAYAYWRDKELQFTWLRAWRMTTLHD